MTRFNIENGTSAPQPDQQSALYDAKGHIQPQYLIPPKRGMSAVLQGIMVAVATVGIVVGLELAAPSDYKPSTLLGTYNGRLAAEIKAHDLETQAVYQEWAQAVQLSVNQQQDAYRTKAQAVSSHYQAALDRAQVFAQSTARIQEAYTNQRMAQTMQTQSGDMAVINFSRMLGNIVSLGDPNAARQIHSYASGISAHIQNELDDAARTGKTISVEGWNLNLATPAQVQSEMLDIPPITIPPIPQISRDAKSEG